MLFTRRRKRYNTHRQGVAAVSEKQTTEQMLETIRELSAAVIRLTDEIETLREQHAQEVEALQQRIAELTLALALKTKKKDSHNSSMPPSSDGYKKPAPRSLKEKSGRKPGGQTGHKGSGMKIMRKPDEVREYLPDQCQSCPHREECGRKTAETRYEYDMEIINHLVAHKVLACNCPLENNQRITGDFPENITGTRQYGSTLKATVLSLLTVGYVSVDRVRQLLNSLGIPISGGAIQNILTDCANRTTSATAYIKSKVAALPVLNCDETGIRVAGKLYWAHCMCDSQWSYYAVNAKRGKDAMEEIQVLPQKENGVLVHDFLRSYLNYDRLEHAFCNAHLQRELVFIHECYHEEWADKLKKLLSEMCGAREERMTNGETAFPKSVLEEYLARYDACVAEGIRLNTPKPIKGRKLRKPKGKRWSLLVRFRDYKDDILRFAYDWTVPFTNNEAERSIRFTKIKQKISGCFRTKQGADDFYRIMSYVSSAKKHGESCFDALLEAVNGRALQLVASWA